MALRILLNQLNTRSTFISRSSFSFNHRNYSKDMSVPLTNTVDFEYLKDKVISREITFVDVREPAELKDDGKIPNSINIPMGQIVEAFKLTDSDFQSKYGIRKPGIESDPFVVSCRSGKRATDAYQKLRDLGYQKISIYSGSFQDWLKNGGPVEK